MHDEPQSDAAADKRLRTVLDAISAILLETDANFVVRTANAAARRFLMGEEDAIVGHPYFSIVEMDPAPLAFDDVVLALRSTGTFTGRVRQRPAGGAWRTFEVDVAPVIDEDGKRAGFVFLNRDVTELDSALALALEEERIRALGVVCARVAHDVNNVLSIVSLSAESCASQMDVVPPELQDIVEACKQGSAMTRDLTEASLGSERAPVSCDVGRTVRTTCRLMQRSFRQGVEVQTSLERKLPDLFLPYGSLEQILIALLSNANDAVADGGKVTVTVRQEAGAVLVEIADDGCGIAERDLAQASAPFFTTKARAKAAGLGLTNVSRMMSAIGGTFTLTSTVGAGSVATLVFPLRLLSTPPS